MKELAKEQLIDLVFKKGAEIVESNAEHIKESILNDVNEAENNWSKMLVKFVTAYGNEVRRECYQVFAEILYEILYSDINYDSFNGGKIKNG